MLSLRRFFIAILCLSFLQGGLISAQPSQRLQRGNSDDSAAPAAHDSGTTTCPQILLPMVDFDPTTYQVAHFTPAGIKIIKRLRDEVRRVHKQFVREFLNLDTVFKSDLIARVEEQHVFMDGPPGSGKTGVADFMLDLETGLIFRIQMHQMTPPSALVGGQNINAALSGEYVHNSKTSILNATAANIDELGQSNPSALQPMLDVLNERRLSTGLDTPIPSKLETAYMTSNLTLPEFLDVMAEINPASGKALLNRILVKQFFFNWLPHDQRMILQERKNLRTRLKTLVPTNPELRDHEVFEERQKIDFPEMRRASELMFVIPGNTEAVLKEFIAHIRRANSDEAKQSLDEYNKDKAKVRLPYLATLDVSTRNDVLFDNAIKASAFIDFLLSPLADDNNINAYLARGPIVLDSLSIWRAYTFLTTIAPGNTHLEIDPNGTGDKLVKVDFDTKIDRNEASTKRDERRIEYLIAEQDRFNTKLQVDLTDYQAKLKQRAEMLRRLGVTRPPDGQDSFELQLNLLSQP